VIALPDDALVIGLGGNVGGEAAIVARFVRAREALAQLGAVKSAPLYRTAWVGPAHGAGPRASGPAQPDFLNTAVRVRYRDGTPAELIATILELERLLGRDRRGEARGGPRAIDLDVLAWGARTLRTPELELPHPRLLERRFALEPLADLFEQARPLLARVADQRCELVTTTW